MVYSNSRKKRMINKKKTLENERIWTGKPNENTKVLHIRGEGSHNDRQANCEEELVKRSAEEAGDTAATEVRGTGLRHMEQPIPKQEACSQGYTPSWRVQSNASRAGAAASNTRVLV